jgi:hypothetical protein
MNMTEKKKVYNRPISKKRIDPLKKFQSLSSVSSSLSFPFLFNENSSVELPKNLLYSDYLYQYPLSRLDLHGYRLSKHIFQYLSSSTFLIISLNLDNCVNLEKEFLHALKSKLSLRLLSLENQPYEFDRSLLNTITSCTSLIRLNLKKNRFSLDAFATTEHITRFTSLKSLNLSYCTGVTDNALVSLSYLIRQSRNLEILDLSESSPFVDEAVIEVIQSGGNILKELYLNNCRQLTSLALSGLNHKMDTLKLLSITNLHLTTSVFSWIGIGCRRSLSSLILSSNAVLDNASLTLLGKSCQHLTSLDISNCLSISDEGIVGFFDSFLGSLSYLNLNNNSLCGNKTIHCLCHERQSSSLKELHCNSLSKITDETLSRFLSSASSLTIFEMSCELKATSKDRTSTVPHLSDHSLRHIAAGNHLQSFIVSGAIMLTDLGISSLVSCCSSLVKLNLSYCSLITDSSLLYLSRATSLQSLQSLNVSACVRLTDKGITDLCHGTFFLKSLFLSGCLKLTDLSLMYLAKWFSTSLEVLSLRSCDLVTDLGIYTLGKYLGNKITSLDISNCDYVTIESVNYLLGRCLFLTKFDCFGCNLTPQEFATSPARFLPFSKPFPGKCHLEKRSLPVIQYNKDIYAKKDLPRAVQTIIRFLRKLRFFKELLREKHHAKQEKALMAFYFIKLRQSVSGNIKIKQRKRRLHAVKVIQHYFRRWYIKRRSIKDLFFRRKRYGAVILLQRVYRGYRIRKRLYVRYRRERGYKDFWNTIVRRYWIVFFKRKLVLFVLLLQRWMRKCLNSWKYHAYRNAIILLQQKFKSKFSSLQEHYRFSIKTKEFQHLSFLQQDKACRIIQKNWKARFFNREISSFLLYCGIVQYSDFQEKEWNSTILQKRFRGYLMRKKRYEKKVENELWNENAIKVQMLWKVHFLKKCFQKKKVKFQKVKFLWKCLIVKRSYLILGWYCKRIQRCYRLYCFRQERYSAANRIYQFYSYQKYKSWKKHLSFLKAFNACVLIQSYWKAYVMKKELRIRRTREHMAAFKIVVCYLFLAPSPSPSYSYFLFAVLVLVS